MNRRTADAISTLIGALERAFGDAERGARTGLELALREVADAIKQEAIEP